MASDFPKNAPSIKDAKPRKKTNVKNYPKLGYAPVIDIDELFNDPLSELWELHEAMVGKPELQDAEGAHMGGPDAGNYEHPVTQQRNEVDYMRAQGMDAVQAHQAVHGDVNTGDIESRLPTLYSEAWLKFEKV